MTKKGLGWEAHVRLGVRLAGLHNEFARLRTDMAVGYGVSSEEYRAACRMADALSKLRSGLDDLVIAEGHEKDGDPSIYYPRIEGSYEDWLWSHIEEALPNGCSMQHLCSNEGDEYKAFQVTAPDASGNIALLAYGSTMREALEAMAKEIADEAVLDWLGRFADEPEEEADEAEGCN